MPFAKTNWKPDARQLRVFGLTTLIALGVIGLALQFWPWGARRTAALVCFIVGGVTGAFCLTGAKVALPVYWAWTAVGFVMSHIVSALLLALVYYGMVTPMGLIMRLFGRDKLHTRRRRVGTYWVDLTQTNDPSRYERQF